MTPFEKTIYFMKKPWVVSLYVILVVIAYHYVDADLALYLHQFNFRNNLYVLNYLTLLGQWSIYVVFFLCLGLGFHLSKNPVAKARTWYLLGCVVTANLVCWVLKIILSRARPELLFTSNQFGFYWFKLKSTYWSFPSGHTMTVVSLASGLGVLFSRYFYILLFLAVLVAATRVLLYYHYLSDVMTGFYLGLLIISMFTHYLKKINWLKYSLN
jgi:membrane-associated phospholipid phosphatase